MVVSALLPSCTDVFSATALRKPIANYTSKPFFFLRTPSKFATAAFDFAMAKRENTFRIDYSNIPRKPSGNELHEFLYKEIGLKEEDVLRLQCSRSLGCAFVKVKSLELAQQTVEQHDNMHEIEVDDKSYRLRFMMEDGTKEVKLYDLSEGTSEDKIIEFLKQYGEVLSIREQMWGDQARYKVSTGIRIVRMMVQKNIDSFVTIDGEKTAVSYYGQRQTCKHCLETVHNGITCVQNKQLQVQKSYADAAKQPGLKKSAPKPAKQKAKTKGTGDSPLVFKTVAQTSSNSTPVNTNTTSTVTPNSQPVSQPGGSGMQPPQQPLSVTKLGSALGGNTREKRTDGNDTDGSTNSSSSRRSLRNINKKKKYNDTNDLDDLLGEN